MADHREHRVSVPDCQRSQRQQNLRAGAGQETLCLSVPGGHDHRLIHPHPECTSLHTTYPFVLLHVPARSLNPKQNTALQKLARTNSHTFHALP
jgi:hypothetical protein